MGRSDYTIISKAKMETLLIEMQGFHPVELPNCKEFVYERETGRVLGDYPVVVRVYSSVDTRTHQSRANGKDAIRVVLMWQDRPLKGAKRVHRIATWAKNLIQRIESVEDTRMIYICKDCEIPMVEKKGKFGRFMGCRNFPKCRISFDIPDLPN